MSVFSNNRFLQRVNPEIVRARADASAIVSKQDETQVLMRQMVDMGIADNLKLWVHSGLVDTRTVGSDVFVPKAYDISGEENDAAQTTEDNQPKLVSLGMEFDSASLFGPPSNSVVQNTISFSVGMWLKSNISSAPSITNAIMFSRMNTTVGVAVGIYIRLISDVLELRYRDNTNINHSINFIEDGLNTNIYYHCFFVRNESTDKLIIYLNGVYKNEHNTGIQSFGDMPILIGGRNDIINFNDQYWDGTLNDIRIFNTALSAAQITAIYNETKGFYGIT